MIGRKVTLAELNEYMDNLTPHRTIDRVIVHHFWRPKAADWKGLATLQAVYDYHAREQGWGDIGYHLVIGPDSTLWLGRPMEKAGAHTIGQNGRSIGIAYAADFDTEEPKENGYEVGVAACAAIVKRFGCTTDDIYFHRDFAEKSCPGMKMDREVFRGDVASVLNKEKEDSYVRLKIDDKSVEGACIYIEDGKATGLKGPIAAALGLKCSDPDERVQVREYLKSQGVVIPPKGWHPEQGPHGTIYAYTEGNRD